MRRPRSSSHAPRCRTCATIPGGHRVTSNHASPHRCASPPQPVLAFALSVALSVAVAWRVHRWAEQTVRLGAVARLSELAAHGSENTKKYAAGALRNMQVRLLELPPDQLKALTPKDDKPKPMFSRESPLDQARALALLLRT